jgi:phosphatidylserine decarboxylase
MTNSSDKIIAQLLEKTAQDKELRDLLLASLREAKDRAEKSLDGTLFKALPWPTNLSDYETFLSKLSRWLPEQSDAKIWQELAAKGQQELDARLSHFYWLVDQRVGGNGTKIIENICWFAHWLVTYIKDFGMFLNTAESFSQCQLNSFIKYSPKYRVQDSMINNEPNSPSGWLSFNQFFARHLNPGLRPISEPFNNSIVCSPADCFFRAQYTINSHSQIPKITIKRSHHYACVEKLLKGSEYKDSFANGTFVHYYLDTFSYHRYHAPVAGLIKECFRIHGLVYLEVCIKDGQFDTPDNAQGAYEFGQARGVLIIDTTNSPYGDIGLVGVVPVGMSQVSSVNMTATIGSSLLKGEEFGYFLFGGSDIIVLFQKGAQAQIDENKDYRLYGSPIACCKTIDRK